MWINYDKYNYKWIEYNKINYLPVISKSLSVSTIFSVTSSGIWVNLLFCKFNISKEFKGSNADIGKLFILEIKKQLFLYIKIALYEYCLGWNDLKRHVCRNIYSWTSWMELIKGSTAWWNHKYILPPTCGWLHTFFRMWDRWKIAISELAKILIFLLRGTSTFVSCTESPIRMY